MRLQSSFWVSATVRSLNSAGLFCAVRAHGADSSGAIIIKLNRLNGHAALFGLAPSALAREDEEARQTLGLDRSFMRLHQEPWLTDEACEQRLMRERARDLDVWILEIEDKQARAYLSKEHPALHFLPLPDFLRSDLNP